jgi:hypothetical protein
VTVEVVIPKTVVLLPILVQSSARRHLAIVQSSLFNIVSVTRVSNPLRKVNKTRMIMVILVMLQLRFAISPTVRTRRNVLRRMPEGVMQQLKHMRARCLRFVRPSLQLRGWMLSLLMGIYHSSS